MTLQPRIFATVLTHNAPVTLARCLAALAAQTRPPDEILVVDNASSPPASLPPDLARARLLRSDENTGPAGGHHVGLQEFLASSATHAWVMDDDCVPASDALAALLAHTATEPPGLTFPTWIDEQTQTVTNWPAWCGLLVDRVVVEAVGLPRAEFFWWAEDTEYLHWRIPDAGFPVRRADRAVVVHAQVRRGGDKPAWKYYYEVRNSVFYRVYVQRRRGRRFYRLARTLAAMVLSAARADAQRGRKLAYVGRGLVDGLTGRLGRRVHVEVRERLPLA